MNDSLANKIVDDEKMKMLKKINISQIQFKTLDFIFSICIEIPMVLIIETCNILTLGLHFHQRLLFYPSQRRAQAKLHLPARHLNR